MHIRTDRDFLHLPIRDLVKNTMNFWKNLISMETFNACTRPWANACADNLAGCLHKPKVAGSGCT